MDKSNADACEAVVKIDRIAALTSEAAIELSGIKGFICSSKSRTELTTLSQDNQSFELMTSQRNDSSSPCGLNGLKELYSP